MRITIPKTLTMAAAAVVIGTTPVMAGKSNDTLVWSTDREADVALPYYNNIREMVIMARLVWDTLMYRDTKTFEYRPQLATSWKWVDNLTIDLELRKGIKFHDGSDFDAEDVAGTFNHLVKDESGVLTRRNVNWMKNVEVLGPYKVRINLAKPFPAAFEFLSGPLA
ncbi:MAG: ABC transporter substrate-binding protein, partial [Alphaproteobacteria bacterium]|nr:ABC transporter substrate-binding protein [Alphaproteobacteria bacterium]